VSTQFAQDENENEFWRARQGGVEGWRGWGGEIGGGRGGE